MDSPYPVNFQRNIANAARYLKILANSSRLIVMSKIVRHPHPVSELVVLTGMLQPALSMHLARLREEEMVRAERRGKEVYYSIANDELEDLVEHVCYRFQCW